MPNVLIVGSSGFIGSALSAYLSEKGYDVHGCDLVNLDVKGHLSHFHLAADEADSFYNIFSSPYDICINCAGAAKVSSSFERPLHDYELNTRIVFRILDAIRLESRSCRFVNLSSAAVYGNPASLPVQESSPLEPISPYGIHKHMSELICNEFHDHFGIQTCSVRIFSAYGPGLKKQLFWDLYQKARRDARVALFGTGEETRDFIMISDLVRVITLIAEQPAYHHRAVNVANGRQVTIKEAASQFLAAYDPGIELQFSGESKTGDPVHWEADISIIKDLGYEPEFSMESGLQAYVEWLKKLP